MTHLDSIIQRCLSREADSFTDLVEATYDEATRRVSRTPGKLVAVYQLIHRHIDQIKKGRDFWPWFDSLTLSVPEEGTQAQKSDILRVCGSVPKARSQYSLRERLASLTLGGWFFGPLLIAMTWIAQQGSQAPDSSNVIWSALLASSFLVGAGSWLPINFLLRPFLDGRRVRLLRTPWVWLLAPLTATGLIGVFSVVILPAFERARQIATGLPLNQSMWQLVLESQESDARYVDQLLASIPDWWVFALVPTSWLLAILARKLHGLAPWVWKRRPGPAYYPLAALLWASLLFLSLHSLKLLIPVEFKEIVEPKIAPFDREITEVIQALGPPILWTDDDEAHTHCRGNCDLRRRVLAVEGWKQAEPIVVLETTYNPHNEAHCPYKDETRVLTLLLFSHCDQRLWNVVSKVQEIAQDPLSPETNWEELRALMEEKGWKDSPSPNWQHSLSAPYEHFRTLRGGTEFDSHELPLKKPNFLWYSPYLTRNLQSRQWSELLEFEKRVKDISCRDSILNKEELRLLHSGPRYTSSSPSRDRYGNELKRHWLAILEVVLYLKQLRAEGSPIPTSLDELPGTMKARLDPFLTFVEYEKVNDDKVLLTHHSPEKDGLFKQTVEVNLEELRSFPPELDQ